MEHKQYIRSYNLDDYYNKGHRNFHIDLIKWKSLPVVADFEEGTKYTTIRWTKLLDWIKSHTNTYFILKVNVYPINNYTQVLDSIINDISSIRDRVKLISTEKHEHLSSIIEVKYDEFISKPLKWFNMENNIVTSSSSDICITEVPSNRIYPLLYHKFNVSSKHEDVIAPDKLVESFSLESIHDYITRSYSSILKRKPDLGGYLHTFKYIVDGNSSEDHWNATSQSEEASNLKTNSLENIEISNELKALCTISFLPVLLNIDGTVKVQTPGTPLNRRDVCLIKDADKQLQNILSHFKLHKVDPSSIAVNIYSIFNVDSSGQLIYKDISSLRFKESDDESWNRVFHGIMDQFAFLEYASQKMLKYVKGRSYMYIDDCFNKGQHDSDFISFSIGLKTVDEYMKTDNVDYDWESFVKEAYTNILEREADVSGLQNAVRSLKDNTLDPNDFVVSLIVSDENMNRYISRRSVERAVRNCQKYKPPRIEGALTIKYMSTVGISGYCKAAKLIVKSLIAQGFNVIYDITHMYYVKEDKLDAEDRLLFSLTELEQSLDPYDVLIIHSVPDDWDIRVANEKSRYLKAGIEPMFKTYGITVWETDAIPDCWITPLRSVDVVSVPSEWNGDVFRKCLPGCTVVTVHHPAEKPTTGSSVKLPIPVGYDPPNDDDYMFYTINEWNNRKGIKELIDIYHETFTSDDKVILYIKTFGNVKKAAGTNYLNSVRSKYHNPPRIILSYDILSTEEIGSIHKRGNCYISLCKAEGMGYGLCEAALWNKPIIATFYGAQGEYLKGCYFANFTIEPANYCSKFDPSHNDCENVCRHNSLYDPATQNWGSPYLPDVKNMMMFVYSRRILEGNPYTKHYLEDVFSIETVGAKFKSSLLDLLGSKLK